MIPAPRPPDEAERLAALRRTALLDTGPEQEFEDLAAVASVLCGTPIALVSLVDEDRQWFKARVGLGVPETPRDQAFCAHAILTVDPLVVDDASRDARFHDNPLVIGGPRIRFYAGAPVTDEDGYRLGTLCAIDTRPRQLEPEKVKALQALARQASTLIAHRRAASSLADASWQLEGLLRSTHLLVQISAPDGRPAYVNDVWKRELGYDDEALARTSVLDVVAPEDRDRAAAVLVAPGDGGSADLELTLLRADGRRLPVHAHVSARPGADGRGGAVLALLRDMSAVREVERLRRELVSNVSHELRTPLTSIRGALGLLRSGAAGALDGEAAELVALADGNAQRLVALVNDLLDLEKLGAGAVALDRRRVELGALAREACDLVRGMASAAGVRVEVEPGSIEAEMDRKRIVQVLTNLLSNAIRFSPAGGRVSVAVGPADDGGARVVITDEGPGVPPAEQARLFERFRQAGSGGRGPGSGLGLAISRAIVEEHGGRIGVCSPPPAGGRGSCFWFEVPRAWGVSGAGARQA